MVKGRSEVVQVVQRYVEALTREGVDVERVYLYGSYLRGMANEWSDIDVIVVSPSWLGMRIWDRARITGQARLAVFKATGESVEALAKTPEEVSSAHPTSFLADVLKDAAVVYERAPASAGPRGSRVVG